MTLVERVNEVKLEYFEELAELMKDYDDIERIMFDETYEISPEADAKWGELAEYSEEWEMEFWEWLKVQRMNDKSFTNLV